MHSQLPLVLKVFIQPFKHIGAFLFGFKFLPKPLFASRLLSCSTFYIGFLG